MKIQNPIKVKRTQHWEDAGDNLIRQTNFSLRSPIIIHNPLALASTIRELRQENSLKDTEYEELKYQFDQTTKELEHTRQARDNNDKNYRRAINERQEDAKKAKEEADTKSNAINAIDQKSDWFIGSRDKDNRNRFEFLSFKPRLINSRIDNSRYGGRRDKLAEPETIARVCENINLEGWTFGGGTGYYTLEGNLSIYDWIKVHTTIVNTEVKLQQFLDEMIHTEQIANALNKGEDKPQ